MLRKMLMWTSVAVLLASGGTAEANRIKGARPREPNQLLCVKLKLVDGALTEKMESKVNVAIAHNEPGQKMLDFNYDGGVPGDAAKIFISLPPNARAIVTARGPEGQQAIETHVITNERFHEGLNNPVDGCFMSVVFTFPSAGPDRVRPRGPTGQ